MYVEKDGKINSYLLFIYLRQKEIAKSNFDSELHGTKDCYHLIKITARNLKKKVKIKILYQLPLIVLKGIFEKGKNLFKHLINSLKFPIL